MSLTKQFISLTETKILLVEVSKGKRKALIEKMIDYFYQDYSTRGKTHRLLEKTFNNYYALFDYIYNNWEDVEQVLPTQNLNPFQKLGHKNSFTSMIKGIGFRDEFNKEEQKIISNSIVFITKLFKSFEKVDPTGNMKYGNWLVDIVFPYVLENGYFNNRISHDDQANANLVIQERGTFFEDMPKLQAYLQVYDEMKQKNKLPKEYKDINNVIPFTYKGQADENITIYNPFQALNRLTKEYRTQIEGDYFEIVESKLEEGKDYEIPVKNADGYIMYLPKSQKANSILGMNTEWCTTYGEHCLNPDYQDRDPYQYEDLIILVNKSNPEEKYQLHFNSGQFMNRDDERMDITNFLIRNESILGWILDLQPDQLDDWIKEYGHGSDKFINTIVRDDTYNNIFEKLMSQLGWVQPKNRSNNGVWILEYDVEAPRVLTTSLEWMKNSFHRDIARLPDEKFLNMILETSPSEVSNINKGVYQQRIDLSPNFAKRWIVHYNGIRQYNNLEIYK